MPSSRRTAAVALAAALLAPAAAADIWQWTDAEGVVRYTPNPDRVPASQRGSLVKVEPGMKLPDSVSAPGPPVMYAPPEELPFGADPFEAPEPARTLEVREEPEAEAPAPPVRGNEAPALRPLSDTERAHRAQLEAQIAADEEALKELISRGSTEGDDPLRESPELREIARRLPALQAQLRALDEAQARGSERAAPEP